MCFPLTESGASFVQFLEDVAAAVIDLACLKI